MFRNITLILSWKEWLSIMKNSILALLLLLVLIPLSLNASFINAETYIVKAGDQFLLQTNEEEFVPVTLTVTPSGYLSLYPFGDRIYVAGKSLKIVEELITNEVSSFIDIGKVDIQFLLVAPYKFHILGAVVKPGAYNTEILLTLFECIQLSGGFTTNASKKVNLIRNNESYEYDLQDYLSGDDIDANPFIMDNDVIIINNAKEYIQVFTNNDTLSYIQTIEIENDSTKIEDALRLLDIKDNISSFEVFSIKRDNYIIDADKDFILQDRDKIYLTAYEQNVYVVGSVYNPGPYKFNGAMNAEYYIALSGGWNTNGSSKKIYIINEYGEKRRYSGQTIKPGDIIYVPESYRSILISYLVPISTIVSVVSTIILLSRK